MKAFIQTCRIYRDRWNVTRQQSINWKIFSGIITVGGFNLIVSLAAVGKDLVVAHRFGTSDAMDAFLIAFVLPSLITNVVAGSFHAAFIPKYTKVREALGEKEAGHFFSNILWCYFFLLIILALILAAMSSFIIPLLASGFDSEKLLLSQGLFLMLMPTLVITGLIKAWGSVLNAAEHFVSTSISPLILQLVTVAVFVLFGKIWGIHALAIGVVAGVVLEAVFMIGTLRSYGYRVMPRWRGFDVSTKSVIRQYMPMIVGSFLMGSALFVDQTMAASIGPGSVSVLSYGNKVVLLILGLSSVALSTAIFPHFSKMVALEDWRNIRHTLWIYTRLILICTIPLTLICIYFSEFLARLIFERGAFTSHDTQLVAQVQSLYLLQVPFYLLGILGVRLLSALIKNQVLMVIGGINLLVNILGNYILMQYWGVAGISLSTSIVYLISVVMIYMTLNRQLKRREILSEGLLEQ